MTAKPIVITMGDPSGVGAEVTVKAIAALPADQRARYAVIGDRGTITRALAATGADLRLAEGDSDAAQPGALRLIDIPTRICRDASAFWTRPAARPAFASSAGRSR